MPSLWDRISRPYESAIEVNSMQQEADPYRQAMNEEYVRQRPGEDFTRSAFALAAKQVRDKEGQRPMPN